MICERTIFRGESTLPFVKAIEAEITVSTPEASPLLLAFYYCASLVACSDNGSGVIRGRSKATLLHAVKARKSGTQIKGLAAVRRPIITVAYDVMGRCVFRSLTDPRASGSCTVYGTCRTLTIAI